MTERRRVLRQNSSLKGEILVGQSGPIRCIVKNVSPQGAMVDVPATATIPDSFRLRATDLDLDTSARTVWRTGTEIGVEFP